MSNNTPPTHVGIILDGNRRWAKQRGLPSFEGHRTGYQRLKELSTHVFNECKIQYLSAFIFSTENWNRSKEEVNYLMDLALWIAKKEVKEFHKKGFKALFLGSRERLSDKLLKAIEEAEALTRDNTGGTLALCFNYGGHEEIVNASRKLVASGVSPNEVTEEEFYKALYAPEVPPIDLLIRTSGEQRLSGFMLYRAAYAELYFSDKYWPDFSNESFDAALAEYTERERRFGK